MRKTLLVALTAVGALTMAACSGASDAEAPDSTVTVATTGPAATDAPDTTEPTTTEVAVGVEAWESITAPADCMCSDGSTFTFHVRQGDPTKVLFFMEGGGACFSAETCAPESETFKRTSLLPEDLAAGTGTGIWDDDNPENPFAGWSVVYVPYCTGDVHIGNATTDYGSGVVVEHKGYVNGTAAVSEMAERFPSATQIVVAGESGGSVPSPLYAGIVADRYPDARITVLADGSGAYPDIPAINGVIGANWGTLDAVPSWPVNEGMTVENWSFPGLFIQAGTHAPNIVFARHDYAFDRTQVFFAGLAGIPADDLVSLIDANEVQIETAGVNLWSYISPGDDHTVLHRDAFYTQTVEGVRLVDWVTSLVAGDTVADVHCMVCSAS
jgi:hypothetical protein